MRSNQTPPTRPRSCLSWRMVSFIFTALIFATFGVPQLLLAGEARLYPDSIPCGPGSSGKKSMLEARVGYLWGFNQILFRDGDNDLILPGKQKLDLDSMIFGLQGETFATEDLAVRAQAWINIPHENRSDFFPDRSPGLPQYGWLGWDSQVRYLQADLAAIYHIGLRGMPYAAGLVAGARYNNFDSLSKRVSSPTGTFRDHLHVYIPYTGVYYAHNDFLGSVMRLDVFFSPFTFSQLDAEEKLAGTVTQIDGHSLTGYWFETLFEWSAPVGDSVLLGALAKYNYLVLSGGATLNRNVSSTPYSTRFSMDSLHHLFVVGFGVTYMF